MNEALQKLHKLKADMTSLKRPRHYAEAICNMTSREERVKALSEVPEEFKDMVKQHVETFFMTRRAKK